MCCIDGKVGFLKERVEEVGGVKGAERGAALLFGQ